MHTKNLGIHRMVLNFSFLPLQALERSIVYKLYLKYSPLLQLGSHLRHSEEPTPTHPQSLLPCPLRARQGGMEEQSPRMKLEMTLFPHVPLGVRGSHFAVERTD